MTRFLMLAMVLLSLAAPRLGAAQELANASSEQAPRFLLAYAKKRVLLNVERMPILAQRLSLDLNGFTRKAALAEVARQAGLKLVYGDDALALDKRVSLQANGITVAAALTDILFGAGVDVVFDGSRQAALVRRVEGAVPGQGGTVHGMVTDSKTGQGLGGVDVSLDATRWRMVTGEDGRYRLADVTPGSYTLAVRRIGYGPERRAVTVTAGQETAVDVVALQPAATRLGDVVVTAQKREERLQDVLISVTMLGGEQLDRSTAQGVADELRRVPGVSVNENAIGGSAQVPVRGVASQGAINRGASPTAYYLDGAPFGFARHAFVPDADAYDLERVEVLGLVNK